MRYGEGLLEEVLARTDLVQLVGRRVKLERKGRIFWGLCPFHKEKSPSFKVENERRTYHCFGCGAGGDAFKWLQENEGLTFPESVERLATEAGIPLPVWSAEEAVRESEKKSLYDVLELATSFYEERLRARAGSAARDFLRSRGLNGEICARHRIGYAPDGNTSLKDHLAAKGVGVPAMADAGLIRAADETRGARDFFFDRIMFPIADPRGRVVAFGGRALSPDAKPKYINTGETVLFSKRRLLYRYAAARAAVHKGAALILAEGYMDVIALVEAGFAGAVAPLGTAVTEDHLQLLWKVTDEPILSFDGDEAGSRAAQRSALAALPLLTPGHSLRFVFLPPGEDPDSFVRAHGAGPMRSLLEKAQPLAEVLWAGKTESRDLSTPERRAGLEAELDEIVKRISDPKIAGYYRREFEERVFKAFKQRRQTAAPRRDALRGSASSAGLYRPNPRSNSRIGQGTEDRRDFRPGFARPGEQAVSPAVKRSLHAVNAKGAARQFKEKELLRLVLVAPSLIERHAEDLAKISLSDPQLDRLKGELLHLVASGVSLEKRAVENHLIGQGMGALVDRLTGQTVSRMANVDGTGAAGAGDVGAGDVGASDAAVGVGEECPEAAWRLALAQLENPDFGPHGELKRQRDVAFERYVDGGGEAELDEVERLNGLLRIAGGLQQ